MVTARFAVAEPGDPPTEPGAKSGTAAGHNHHGGEDPLAGLSEEERQRLREVMRRAWSDPAVIQAREEIQTATKAYQQALRDAIELLDLELIDAVEKIRDSSAYRGPFPENYRGGAGGGPRGNGEGPLGGGRGFDDFLTMESPPFLKDLSEEDREIYREAHRKARESEPFKTTIGRLKEVREQDDTLRDRKVELFREVRRVLTAQMVEADPRVKDILAKFPHTNRRGPEEGGGGGPPKGGKGGPKPPFPGPPPGPGNGDEKPPRPAPEEDGQRKGE